MNTENDKIRYSVGKKNFFARLAVVFMLLSVLCRFLGYWGFWSNQTPAFAIFQIALPILCCVLFALIVLYAGRRFFALSFIPVVLGVVFFIIKSFGFGSILHTVLCICLYLAVAFIYTATVFGVIRTKWLLVPLFGLPLAVHIFLDKELFVPADGAAVSLNVLLPEISVLCIMAALLSICFAMKRRDFAAERVQSPEQQTIDLLVSNEEPPASETAEQNAEQEGEAHE